MCCPNCSVLFDAYSIGLIAEDRRIVIDRADWDHSGQETACKERMQQVCIYFELKQAFNVQNPVESCAPKLEILAVQSSAMQKL